MSVETRSATSSQPRKDSIESTSSSSVEPTSQAASTSPTSEPQEAPLRTRTITRDPLEENLLDGIDADQISSQYYRITPPPTFGRASPLLFAASFDQAELPQPPVVTPQPIMQPPVKEKSASAPPAPPMTKSSNNKPTHPPSLIHHPPNIAVPRNNPKPAPPQVDSPTSENTGRWTAEEHRLFLQGLEEHGKGWKKIASLIQTRTVVQIRTHAQKYFQKLAKARANGEVEEEKIVTTSVPMRTVPGNMSLGTDSVSMAAAAGQVGTGSIATVKRSRRTGGTKRRAIGSVVRSSVREGRTSKRQKMAQAKRDKKKQSDVPNPLPAISSILDPYVLAPPVLGVQPQDQVEGKKKTRGRQQLVQTATHGTIPMAALEDAVFRLLTPAPGATGQSVAHAQPAQSNASIVDPLAPNSVKISAPYPQVAAASVPNSSPTCVTDMAGFPSWVDAKNPPTWYNNGEDIDKLLEDAEDLNWLCDTGDLEETYPPAVAATAAAVSNEPSLDLEPTPVVNIQPHEYAAYDPNNTYAVEAMDPTLVNNPMTHPSVESLSFLVDSPKEGIDEMPTFLEEEQPEAALSYSTSQEAIVEAPQGELPEVESQHLMSFPDLDMGDEQAFVSALLDTSKESALSFSKWGSQNGVAELGDE